MNKSGFLSFWNGLPMYAKGALSIGGVLIAWFGIANPIRKLIVSKLNASKMAKEGKEAANELSKLKKQGVNPTISVAQAQSFSNSLVSAFAGCGTDENAIYRVMDTLNNDADVYLLIATYGTKKYDGCNWEMNFGDSENSLSGAMSDELDPLNKYVVNGILEKKKIKFRFT